MGKDRKWGKGKRGGQGPFIMKIAPKVTYGNVGAKKIFMSAVGFRPYLKNYAPDSHFFFYNYTTADECSRSDCCSKPTRQGSFGVPHEVK